MQLLTSPDGGTSRTHSGLAPAGEQLYYSTTGALLNPGNMKKDRPMADLYRILSVTNCITPQQPSLSAQFRLLSFAEHKFLLQVRGDLFFHCRNLQRLNYFR